MILKPIITKHMEAQQKIFKNRHLTVGASEIGRCARQTWYVKHHPAAQALDEISYGAIHRGNMLENHLLVPALRRHFGGDILFSGKDQKTFIDGDNSATPDGLLINQPANLLAEFGIKDIGKNRCVLIEAKSIDPRITLRAPKPEHARQALQQLGVVRAATEWKPEHCLIVYINASFHDDITEFVVSWDERKYELQKKRAAEILSATTARSMQPEGWIKGGKECDHCGFSSSCTELRSAVPPESKKSAPPQVVAELKELATLEREQAAIASSAEEEQRKLQLKIKDLLREKGLRGVKEPDIVVTWYPIRGRVTYDMNALREAAEKINFNIAPYEKIGDASDGLRITVGPTLKPTATKGSTATGKSKTKAKAK